MVTRKVLDMYTYSLRSSWMLQFKTYNIVDRQSDIMQYVDNGDIFAILNMFVNRTATPNDRTAGGSTILGACRIMVCLTPLFDVFL